MTNEYVLSGDSFHGGELLRRLQTLGDRIIPPYPDKETVPLPVAPTMPDFRWEAPLDCQVEFLLRVHSSACAKVLHRGSFIKLPPTAPTFARLGAFLPALRACDVHPIVWVLHSVNTWKHVSATKNPTLTWMFALTRLQKQQAACRQATVHALPVPIAHAHTVLVETWTAMHRALLQANPTTAAEVAYVVDQFFPRGTYEDAVRNARASVASLQRQMLRASDEGEVFWTL